MVSYMLLYAVMMSLVIKLIEGAFSIGEPKNPELETSENDAFKEY